MYEQIDETSIVLKGGLEPIFMAVNVIAILTIVNTALLVGFIVYWAIKNRKSKRKE
jgi:hypothetical protein